ncbi:MAG: DUF4440 domain-containing protein [Caulobacteraceae bacterium]|nr:DUF4440 domain-containing protein [Caulobacteraceae bacterium]
MNASPPILGLCAAAAVGACAPATSPPAKASADTAKIVDAIKTDEVHWNADYKSGDPARIAAHYAPGAVLMVPGVPPAIGAGAIEAVEKQAIGDPGFTLAFSSDKVDVAASGDLAVAHGTYKQTTTNPKTKAVDSESGSYVTLYKPGADGSWKAVWDINTPGPATNVGAVMTGAATAAAPQ